MSFAARMGDMTAHGGTIVVGFPTVLICGMPAARLMDMHVCPMVTPAPVPVPHVGGPISGPGSATVLIGGMPAARVGDMAVCVGPPDVIIPPGCATVMIGMAGAGGGAGGGGGGGAAAGATSSAATALVDNKESSTKEEHWIEFEFVDSAGLPVSGYRYTFEDPDGDRSQGSLRTDGCVRRDGLSEGSCNVELQSVSNARWSSDGAEPEEEITLNADTEGFEDGTAAVVEIWRRDIADPDVVVESIETTVQQGGIELSWQYVLPEIAEEDLADDHEPDRFSAPQYYFEVIIEGCRARSGLLSLQDWVEIVLKDDDGEGIGNKDYRLHLPSGQIEEGTLDGAGVAKVSGVPPGRVRVEIDPRE
ncbi:MAG: PAAR domain-containing protein [Rhodothermales bacterium]|nr:PAAR domain-containing protein [Rhodothermales bacterium]